MTPPDPKRLRSGSGALTKPFTFLGKFKSTKREYVALEPFEYSLAHDFGKLKAAPKELMSELESICKKTMEEVEGKCNKGIDSLEKEIEKILQHALLAAQMSRDKAPIKRAAKEAEALIKKANSAIEKEADTVAGLVETMAKKALAKKFPDAFKSYGVYPKADASAALSFLFVEPKIKVKDDKLPAAQGLRKGALDIGKEIAAASRADGTLSTELEKCIAAHTAALWRDEEFTKSGGINQGKELWKKHGKLGQSAADKLDEYSEFAARLAEKVEQRIAVVEARTKKLKKEIGDMEDEKAAPKAADYYYEIVDTNKKLRRALKEVAAFADAKTAYAAALKPLLSEKGVTTKKGSSAESVGRIGVKK